MDTSVKRLMKKCRICGDKATSHNFGIVSCSCCKVFFLRNWKNQNLKCRHEGKCEINMITRKSCPACRLAKCFSVGMKIKPKSPLHEPNNCNTNFLSSESIRKILESEFLATDFCKCHQIKRSRKRQTLELTSFESSQIEAIRQAMQVFPEENELPIAGYINDIVSYFNLPGFYAKRIVSFCKSFDAFRLLSLEDQMSILKPYYFDLCCVRFEFVFDKERDCVPLLENDTGSRVCLVPFDIFNSQIVHRDLAKDNHVLIIQIHDAMENDTTIRNLLCAQFLFKPRENVSCNEFLRYYFFFYQYLLQRYLEQKYQSIEKAAQKVQTLIELHNRVNFAKTKENLTKILPQIKLKPIGKVLEEVFECKN